VLFASAEELPMTPTGKVQKFRLVREAQERLEHAAT
jgi:acyl-CoA synthetase (AMP-forming)/AMP-acid ligase II